MEELTKKAFWDGKYGDAAGGRPGGGLKTSLRRLLGERFTRGYHDYEIWELIYERFMPRGEGLMAMEIGSAPGHHLVQLHQRFGLEPYGVEYSDSGAELNRVVFEKAGIPSSNVIHSDFFSDEFAEAWRGRCDVLLSRGFIEHFSDLDDVMERHVDLLGDGGLLVLSVPNFLGLYGAWAMRFDPELLAMHNVEAMRKERLEELAAGLALDVLFLDHVGALNFNALKTSADSPFRWLRSALLKLQWPLNAWHRLRYGERGCHSPRTGPLLMLIGRKR